MWCNNWRVLILSVLLILSTLFNGLQAQDRVLAWEHSGPVHTFRVIIDGKPPVDVGVPRVDGRLQWPILAAATSFIVEACNALGVCAQSQTLAVPVPVPAPPTNLQIAVIGNLIPIKPDPVGTAPLPPTSPSPATGATGISLTPTLTAVASNYTNCKVRFDTANPPVTEIDLGASCTFSPTGLVYSTLYRWRFVLTNQHGSTIGDVWTLTTMADPGPPPDPDPGCASVTTSPTGYQPISWTPCRQDTMDQMEADYVTACPGAITLPVCGATPATNGGKYFKQIKELADAGGTGSPARQHCAWMYQATAASTYATCTYAALDAYLTSENDGFCPTPNTTILTGIIRNNVREHSGRVIKFTDVIKPAITGGQYDDLVVRTARWIQGSLHYACNAAPGMNLGDSDQTTGEYFSIVTLYLRNPSCALCATLYEFTKVGGLTPTKTPEVYALAPDTARNAIRYYVEWLGASGEWIESSHYNRGTANLLMEGADMIKTITGVDHFPEVTAWIPLHSAFLRSSLTPDLTQIVQWADIESSQVRKFDMSRYSNALGNVAGLQRGTTEGRKVHDLYNDLVAQYGATGYGSFYWGIGSHPFWIYDPYDTPVDRLDAISGFFEHNRSGYRKSHISNSTAAYFHTYWGGPNRFSATNEINGPKVHHSEGSITWGNWELFEDAAWQMSYILGGTTTGPGLVGGDGGNVAMIHGYTQTYSGVSKLWSADSTDYYYIAGTNGGGALGTLYCGGGNTSEVYNHETTRSLLFWPGSVSTAHVIIAHDRLNAPNILPERNCYTTAQLARIDLFDAFHAKLLINHMYNSPTQVGDAFSWATETGKAAKLTVGFPATFTPTIINEKTTVHWANWNATIKAMAQARFHLRVAPTDNVQFNTFGTVTEFGPPGAVVEKEDSGKVQGFHITRPDGSKDILALFNSEQGANLNLNAYHASHNEDLAVARLRETGFTITWTAVSTSGTHVVLSDLNPANTWTYTIDGGASTPITEDANGQDNFTVTGTGAHTIVVTGT